jgi:hypothetical protein
VDPKIEICAAVAIAAGLMTATAEAQQTGQVMIDVSECIRLDAPDARLACYEARVAALFRERAAQAAVAAPAAPAAPTAATPPAAAAASEARRPAAPAPERTVSVPVTPQAAAPAPERRAERRRTEAQEEPAEVVSVVRELREVVPNAYLVTLENGQVWRQTEPKQYPLRPGLKVRIYGTRWGSASRLTAEELKSYIQVERVR